MSRKSENKETVRRLFGTDGIRGRANIYPMTAELVLNLGRAAGKVFKSGEHRHTVLIGKDTRLSGYMFESALTAGFTSMGVHCLLVGPLPTPAIAYLTRALRCDAGVVISASHNRFEDNGIKFFGPDGKKLADETEHEIEGVLFSGELDKVHCESEEIGRARRLEDAGGRYVEFCKNTFPKDLRLDGLRIVVDSANGAAYKVAPAVFWELGAEVISIHDQPDGANINRDAGSLHPRNLSDKVREVRADIGLAFDGDADRLMVCDDQGKILDGDHILAICALDMKRKKTLKGKAVVATVMSNLGLERYLTKNGIKLERAQVGDRYVLERMLANDLNLGGEQSGHLIFTDYNTTGDGIIAALRVLEIMAGVGKPLSELGSGMKPVPQVLLNVVVSPKTDAMGEKAVQAAIAKAEKELGDAGRILVRKSGTEPKIRVMIEGDDQERIDAMAEGICDVIRRVAG